jgi:hypothetical protein
VVGVGHSTLVKPQPHPFLTNKKKKTMIEIFNTTMNWLMGYSILLAVLAVAKVMIICFFMYLIMACIAKWGG